MAAPRARPVGKEPRMASIGFRAAVEPLPTAPLCERAQTPDACQLSRNFLNLCETMGLGDDALRTSCSNQLWSGHDACRFHLTANGSDAASVRPLCVDQADRMARNASLRLVPEARARLEATCHTELRRLNRQAGVGTPEGWCRALEEKFMETVVADQLVAT
jgi:hypothetical protein